MSQTRRTFLTATAATAATGLTGLLAAAPAAHADTPTPKSPLAVGEFGAVACVDADATDIGVAVLRGGGNAVDAAVATAAALGVAEPYSCGLGGGGYFVHYDAATRRVTTLDGRETAPALMGPTAFIDPSTGRPYPFATAVTSGLSVGTPGSPATWAEALRRWGTRPLARLLGPAIDLAEHGFVVDQTFHDQTSQNAARFATFPATAALYLPGGAPTPVGSRQRNPDLAATYRQLARRGIGWLYHGALAHEIAAASAKPPTAAGVSVLPGLLRPGDLARYRVLTPAPTHVRHAGLDVYSMGNSSSGGITSGLALNILKNFDLAAMSEAQWLHHYLEATRLAFADRNRWVGDPAYVTVPTAQLLSDAYARSRACLINPDRANPSPIAPGDPYHPYACGEVAKGQAGEPYEGRSTTHMVVTDRWGNTVSYTFTIEQTGGSGSVLPGRGFILNNEMTDFDFAPLFTGVPDPNLPAPGKRPRSAMSPTILLDSGRPRYAVGSPGGATIITTVLEILLRRLDLGEDLLSAVAAVRVSQRNSNPTQSEPAFDGSADAKALQALGDTFDSSAGEIGAATALEFLGGGLVKAVAEPVRRGGGAAAVVRPA
ncbi:gamma-glutamyltransferase [Mangrovactinospora gilvigrisea]|uniref:Glutathione hydrolase proenzyme n=1 Tax=Mangrovactinospora gilvigrisea TaxID=1428644 RepID=A0A1J7BG75_9ACTN|nr:gamma-glutamyltransferase [Mangrovactinospora gilvigrisea]OIV37581.1 gamma-glutamyltransferase [Mangrovactinospora gilvigrisea]